MSETQSGKSALDLKRIDDEEQARAQLTVDEYERWEKLKAMEAEAEQNRERMAEDAEVATQAMVATDLSTLAVDVDVFGNDLACYYDPESEAIRDAVERVSELAGVDETDDPSELEGASVDDVDESDIPAIKEALADLVLAAVVKWEGATWSDLDAETRADIRETIQQSPPEGWGLAGLMDAFVEIYVAVEDRRDERLERIQRFRDPERRGDR